MPGKKDPRVGADPAGAGPAQPAAGGATAGMDPASRKAQCRARCPPRDLVKLQGGGESAPFFMQDATIRYVVASQTPGFLQMKTNREGEACPGSSAGNQLVTPEARATPGSLPDNSAIREKGRGCGANLEFPTFRGMA